MEENTNSRLQHFPVSWFAVIMGMTGFTIAWHKAEALFSLPQGISAALLTLTLGLFLLLLGFYVAKFIRYPEAVAAELSHPVKLNFFPTLSISLILLSAALIPYYESVSRVSWTIGTLLQLGLTLYVLSAWLHGTQFEVVHINPAWFIPIVGNILVPIAGVRHASPEISWFFFSIGLVFWLVLLSIIFYRMFFHQPLPAKLLPTLFILIAPPAAGFISWIQLTGEVDIFARILYYTAVFLTLMLMTQARRFLNLDFYLSWWAYSFPSAAITIATLIMYEQLQLSFFQGVAGVMLVLLTLLVVLLTVKTLQGVRRQTICVED